MCTLNATLNVLQFRLGWIETACLDLPRPQASGSVPYLLVSRESACALGYDAPQRDDTLRRKQL
jgi:hypothetical protein